MKNYFSKILNNCDEVSLHTVMGIADRASLRKRLEYKFHILFCKCCYNFKKQSEKIDTSIESILENIEKEPPFVLPENFKKELKEKIK
jgi:hypothetical protein